MALSNEDLLAISQLLDIKLKSEAQDIKTDLRDVKLNIENILKPQMQLLAENYVPAAQHYERSASKIESIQADMKLLQKIVSEHSERLQQLA